MTDRVAAVFRERVWCAIDSLTLGADGAACRLVSVFGGVIKFEGGTASGVDSTLRGGTILRGGVSLGGGGGGASKLLSGGVSMVLVLQLLNRSRIFEMDDSCSW